jgi:hypothetical protein
MKKFDFEVTKTIVVSIEATSEDAARVQLGVELEYGDANDSFRNAEPQVKLLGTEDV